MKLQFFNIIIIYLIAGCTIVHNPITSASSYIVDTTTATGAGLGTYTGKAVSVNSHGVTLDTDGDGIPDYRDKELLTLMKCFPVDNNGVGVCPEPPCCGSGFYDPPELHQKCEVGEIQIRFANKSKELSESARRLLGIFAKDIKANPECKVRIGGASGTSKFSMNLSWNRVNTVFQFLVEKKGISEDRFIFSYDMVDDPNTVGVSGSKEFGPNVVPAPRPSRKRNDSN